MCNTYKYVCVIMFITIGFKNKIIIYLHKTIVIMLDIVSKITLKKQNNI